MSAHGIRQKGGGPGNGPRSASGNAPRKGILARLKGDRRGVGAIEFAFIAPLMVVLYIGAVEVSVAMSVNKKLARASSTVADLITQGSSTNRTELTKMVNVARSIMAPYDPDPAAIVLTGIEIGAGGTPTIVWSWKPNNGTGERAYTVGVETSVPENLKVPDTFLVRSEIDYRHSMITSFPFTGRTMTGIDMQKTYFLRPRVGSEVDCTNC